VIETDHRPTPGSFSLVSREACRDRRVGWLGLRVLGELSAYRNAETGLAFPSTLTIAAALLVSQRAVQKQLKALEQLGYVREVVDPRYPNRRSRTWLIIYPVGERPTERWYRRP